MGGGHDRRIIHSRSTRFVHLAQWAGGAAEERPWQSIYRPTTIKHLNFKPTMSEATTDPKPESSTPAPAPAAATTAADDDDEEDLEKLQAEIAKMEQEAAKIAQETAQLEQAKAAAATKGEGGGAASARTTGAAADAEEATKRDGYVSSLEIETSCPFYILY